MVELDELQQSLAGSVIDPASPEYDAARRCFNAAMDRRPAVIVRCRGAQDVATAFDFARTHSLEVAVRGGGHNPAGHCVVDGGLVIDLSEMRRVDVDLLPALRVRVAARPGSTSTRQRRRSASSRQVGSSARPASVGSRSAVASGT